jgi:hypothetical protein
MKYKIYLDVCCLNRPFDDLRQDRVQFESDAVLGIEACTKELRPIGMAYFIQQLILITLE